MNRILFASFVVSGATLAGGCKLGTGLESGSPSAPAVGQQVFRVRGIVRELRPDGRTVLIQHEEIPGYMAAMTMPLEVRDPDELRGLRTNDSIAFRMVVTDKEGWIEGIEKLSAQPSQVTNPISSPESVRRVPDVEALAEGDLLPEYHFTNELGRAVSTKQFLGKAVALTFIFTSCPFPEFCPRMSNNFQEAAEKLKSMPTAPTNWHLLSISFDTRVDTPERLLTYARAYGYDPTRWSFLTGTTESIEAICEQLGLSFWRDGPINISHNLRTAVIDSRGRVQKILPANKWTSDELVEELVKAAAAK